MADATSRQTLTDHRFDWRAEATVDREARTLANVAIAATLSRNGYRYAEAALQAAAALYDGKHVYIGNPDLHKSGIAPPPRHPRDLAGIIQKPRYAEGRIRADIQALPTEAGNTLLALAEANPPNVGLSHVVAADRKGNEITRIAEVTCVELVMNPATTTTFTEAADTNPHPDDIAAAVAQIRQEITALRQYVEAHNAHPQSHDRAPPNNHPTTDEAFVAALKTR